MTPQDLLQIFGDAIPFGQIDPEAIASQINDLKASRVQDRQKRSIKGFWDYINDRSPDELEETLNEIDESMRRLERPPVPDWRSGFMGPDAESLTPAQIADLVQALENQKEAVLFRLPEEVRGAPPLIPKSNTIALLQSALPLLLQKAFNFLAIFFMQL